MPWKTSRPNGQAVDAKYRTPEHRAKVAEYAAQLARDGYLICAQTVCLMPNRTILPGMPRAAGHDPTGTHYLGPVHRRCNSVDGAKQGRARQISSPLRW